MASFSDYMIADAFNPVGLKPRFDLAHRVRMFGGIDEVVGAGFDSASWVYKQAARVFSQSPHIGKVYVGWKCPAGLADSTLAFSAPFVTGNEVTLTIDGETLDAVRFDDEGTSEGVIARLVALINEAFTGRLEATATDSGIALYGCEVTQATLAVTGGADAAQTVTVTSKAITADAAWTDALNAMAKCNNDFYAMQVHESAMAGLQEAAEWASANSKLLGIASSNTDIADGDGGDIADWAHSKKFDRTFIFYSTDECIVSAVFGKMLTKTPGSATWALKAMEATATDNLTAAERNTLKGKCANWYTEVSGLGMTNEGTVASGEYIDIIHGIDYYTAKIQAAVISLLSQQDKIPYTNEGIAMIQGTVKVQLDTAQKAGFLASYNVTVPDVADVDTADKAGRFLQGVKFTGVLAGAIHKVRIDGVVTL